jgi:hypothetical protein
VKDQALQSLFRESKEAWTKKPTYIVYVDVLKIVLDIDWWNHVEVPNSKLMEGVRKLFDRVLASYHGGRSPDSTYMSIMDALAEDGDDIGHVSP